MESGSPFFICSSLWQYMLQIVSKSLQKYFTPDLFVIIPNTHHVYYNSPRLQYHFTFANEMNLNYLLTLGFGLYLGLYFCRASNPIIWFYTAHLKLSPFHIGILLRIWTRVLFMNLTFLTPYRTCCLC